MPFESLSLLTFFLMSFVAPTPDAPCAEAVRSVARCVAPRHVLGAEPFCARTIERLWDRSPMFRRQVARLSAGALLVTIERSGRECPDTVRAQTTVKYRDGVPARANVRIQFRPAEHPEPIAHELEHVIEQLDGVDLARLARRGNHVIHVDRSGRYETARAHQIGRAVAAEYRAGVDVASTCERRTP